MIRILSFTAQNSGAEIAVKIEISDGEHREVRRLVIMTEQYADMRLSRGEIDSETFDKIESAAELCRALRRGNEILGYGANSERRLSFKLRQKGFSAESAEEAARILSEKGFINESDDAAREAERCVSKFWGKRRITAQLYSKGYDGETVRYALALLDEVDFADNCQKLILKKYRTLPTDTAGLQKLTAALMRYGYSLSEIKEAINSIRKKH